MGQIIGLGVTHYPGLYAPDEDMAMALRRTLAGQNIPKRAKNPENWPATMRAEWNHDEGAQAARSHRERCFSAFRSVREKLDRFAPDFIVILGDDQYENFVEDIVPPFCIYILDDIVSLPFKREAGAAEGEANIWREGPATAIRHKGHAEGARFIVNRLGEEGLPLPYAYRLRSKKGLAHAFINTLMFLDADRLGFDFPVIPIHINCYGGALVRSQGGRLPPGDGGLEPDPPAPSASACFDLGRALGRVLFNSPWRIALIASSSWSHAFLTAKNDWIYPDHASDLDRLKELKEGRSACWRDLTRARIEDAGQHELLNWIVLAGSMVELGYQPQIIDYIETHVFNSNKCFASWNM